MTDHMTDWWRQPSASLSGETNWPSNCSPTYWRTTNVTPSPPMACVAHPQDTHPTTWTTFRGDYNVPSLWCPGFGECSVHRPCTLHRPHRWSPKECIWLCKVDVLSIAHSWQHLPIRHQTNSQTHYLPIQLWFKTVFMLKIRELFCMVLLHSKSAYCIYNYSGYATQFVWNKHVIS